VLVHRIAGCLTDVIQIAGSLRDAIAASYCPTPHPINLQSFICCYSVRMEVVFLSEKNRVRLLGSSLMLGVYHWTEFTFGAWSPVDHYLVIFLQTNPYLKCMCFWFSSQDSFVVT
jgi:hypothetical protein